MRYEWNVYFLACHFINHDLCHVKSEGYILNPFEARGTSTPRTPTIFNIFFMNDLMTLLKTYPNMNIIIITIFAVVLSN